MLIRMGPLSRGDFDVGAAGLVKATTIVKYLQLSEFHKRMEDMLAGIEKAALEASGVAVPNVVIEALGQKRRRLWTNGLQGRCSFVQENLGDKGRLSTVQ